MSWIEWPSALQPRDINIIAPNKTRSMTQSLTEFEQIVPVIRPPWRVVLQFSTLVGDQVLAWRAMIAALEGRANLIRLPIFDLHHWASDAQIAAGETPHSSGAEFSNGNGYLIDDLSGVVAACPQGAKEALIDFGSYGPVLTAGQYFGLGNDLHIVTSISWAGAVAAVQFTPSARRTHTATEVKLRPHIIAHKSEDEGGDLNLQFGRWGEPVLDLTESFYELLP